MSATFKFEPTEFNIKSEEILDLDKLRGLESHGEKITVPANTGKITVQFPEGTAVYIYCNIDRERRGGFAVPRTFPTRDYYPNYIGNEGFWHPYNDVAKEVTRKA